MLANDLTQPKVESLIFTIRGRQVLLDNDLAMLYGIETKQLNRQVNRNIERFPDDFMFQLTQEEFEFFAVPNWHRKIGEDKVSSIRIHRKRRGDAQWRSAFSNGYQRKYQYNAHFQFHAPFGLCKQYGIQKNRSIRISSIGDGQENRRCAEAA